MGDMNTNGRIPSTLCHSFGLVHSSSTLSTWWATRGTSASWASWPISRSTASWLTSPIYLQIAALVIGRIRRGDLEPRDPIPSESQMVQEYGIGRETARHVVAHLREEGWVFTLARRGSYVSARENWPSGER